MAGANEIPFPTVFSISFAYQLGMDISKRDSELVNQPMNQECPICRNQENNKVHIAREMMFGWRHEFPYLECSHCGCLHLLKPPENLSDYYPKDYYSFGEPYRVPRFSFIWRLLRHFKHAYWLRGRNLFGAIMSLWTGPAPGHFRFLRQARLNFHSSILDVGCGSGSFLNVLRRDDFTHLFGVDPYIKETIRYDNGIVIWKKDFLELDQYFDFIIMNHSFEHMPNPLEILQQVYRLLNPDRYVLIRIPVASSQAWKQYGVNWVQLDAPRHLFLHTEQSMRILADQTGLQLKDVFYDSTEFQFTGSEMYQKDIALSEKKPDGVFTQEQMDRYRHQAKDLNQQHLGDQAGFFLYKSK
jgi:SAM-dependent methyltransferase